MHDPFEGYFGNSETRKVGTTESVKGLELSSPNEEVKDTSQPAVSKASGPLQSLKLSDDAYNVRQELPPPLPIPDEFKESNIPQITKVEPPKPQVDPEEFRKAELRKMVTDSFSARKENTGARGILRSIPAAFFIIGFILSVGTGAVAANLYSASALKDDVTEITGQKKIISNVAVLIRDTKRLGELDKKESKVRQSIMIKTSALWFLISAAFFAFYARFILR
ncbi:hypothetical protein KKF34_08850 [Myxococcota bacterium]|nr:hypothetical protein [Myxococcota bacterium]MBU1380626.1 hypothetical protein [Myxococcota bacterium]MBU1496969.1 hypothetical protein [Myxococcota bacterium]